MSEECRRDRMLLSVSCGPGPPSTGEWLCGKKREKKSLWGLRRVPARSPLCSGALVLSSTLWPFSRRWLALPWAVQDGEMKQATGRVVSCAAAAVSVAGSSDAWLLLVTRAFA